ncbi:hypothetical protein K1T71_000169 [Dendrolimus kikuchii]|uniref:Uncharacterized protein n=1 Tax=Dendrolimus kikuchii TaxID=765133 RepID=A0ACC1DIM7_9NEOP|nr:hypothetical protein K1T71_000169 [Dendrolimus kikuchii]
MCTYHLRIRMEILHKYCSNTNRPRANCIYLTPNIRHFGLEHGRTFELKRIVVYALESCMWGTRGPIKTYLSPWRRTKDSVTSIMYQTSQSTTLENRPTCAFSLECEKTFIRTIFHIFIPSKFRWRASSADGEVSGSGEGFLRAGGVYVLCVRERLGRLDAAVLHAPNPPNELNLAWIIPQYLLVSIAEIMFAVSGLEFCYNQAPKTMKTITIAAAWYASVAFGNLIVILVAQTKIFESRAIEFFGYAALLAVAMLLFLQMSLGYKYRNMEGDASSTESRPLLHRRLKVISVHSLSTSSIRAFRGVESSEDSFLGEMDRTKSSAWPAQAYVHVATPSSGDPRPTTLAK